MISYGNIYCITVNTQDNSFCVYVLNRSFGIDKLKTNKKLILNQKCLRNDFFKICYFDTFEKHTKMSLLVNDKNDICMNFFELSKGKIFETNIN